MATYWVPDLPNIEGIFGHLLHPIFIFANGASYAWSSKHKYVTLSWKLLTLLKSSGLGMKKSELPWEHNFL